jgi:predicted GNAT family acetyltransferase
VLRTGAARVLDARDLDEVLALVSVDPVADTFVASRIETAGLDPWRLGAEIWGFGPPGKLESVCYSGANLVPVQAGPDAVRAFAERARRQGRRCSSIVGPSPAVLDMWRMLLPHWGPAREVREIQPLMSTDSPPRVAPDPEVRLVHPDEIDILMPACTGTRLAPE